MPWAAQPAIFARALYSALCQGPSLVRTGVLKRTIAALQTSQCEGLGAGLHRTYLAVRQGSELRYPVPDPALAAILVIEDSQSHRAEIRQAMSRAAEAGEED